MAAVPTNGSLDLDALHAERNVAKRGFDVVFSVMALLATMPILAGIALLVWTSSRGGVFYRKPVLGRCGRKILMLKFRTMYADAAERLTEMLETDAALMKEWEETQKLKEDPRITAVGQVPRRLSLDELPQFWNVLRGDLSVVGPRPYFRDAKWYTEGQLETFLQSAPRILSVRPGITGVWATSGRAALSFDDRVRLDERYVDTHNAWDDVRLIARTIPAIFSSRGAY